jgi:hypothetical protein
LGISPVLLFGAGDKRWRRKPCGHGEDLKHPLIFYFGLLGECFDRRDSRAFPAFVPKKLLVFQSSNNINSYNQITRGVLSY